MRKHVKDFIQAVIGTFQAIEPVYEFGSFLLPGQEKLADLRPLFPGKQFMGTDYRAGPGVDKILDLHDTGLPSESVGTALILDTLEHVKNPILAMNEIYRILKPGGLVIISSVMFFPMHDYPYDYWRFTPEAFKTLLNQFETRRIYSSGLKNFPHTVSGVGIKKAVSTEEIDRFEAGLKKNRTLNGGWKEAVLEMMPPIISFPLYQLLLKKKS